MVDSSVLASTHWDTYVKIILEAHGEHPNSIEKCGDFYHRGFIIGFGWGNREFTNKMDQDNMPFQLWGIEFRKLDHTLEDFFQIRKYEVHYITAFIHGFKHGKEAQVHY